MTSTIFRKIGLSYKRMKKARKAKKDIPIQKAVAEKLDTYIAEFLDGKIEKFTAIPKKPELVGKKIFWQYWHQGIDENTPKVVVSCLNSVKKYRGEYEIILLSRKTLNDYIELPDFVWEKLGTGGFNFTKLSNLVRLYLLSAYGGVWLDATIYLTKPLNETWLQKDFFALQRSEIPPSDAAFFNKVDPAYFTWNPDTQVKILNSFMIAKPGNKIVSDLLSIHLEYWKKEEKINHYFFFQIMFNRMMLNDEWEKLNCEIVGDTDCHKLQLVAFDKFDQRIYDEALAKSNIHKLTLYLARKKISAGSFADFLMNGKI